MANPTDGVPLPNNYTGNPDKYFLDAGQQGLDIQNASPSARPYFTPSPSLRNRVQAALGAFGQGGQAVQAYTRGNLTPDAFGAFMAGAGGGLGAPTAQDIAAAEAKRNAEIQMAQLDATPIEQISPAIVQEHPELAGVPLGSIQKVSGLISSASRQKAALQLMAMKEAFINDRQRISESEEAEIIANYARAGVTIQPGSLRGQMRSAAVNILPSMVFDPQTGGMMWGAPRSKMLPAPVGLTEVRGRGDAARALSTELEELKGLFAEAGPEAEGRVMGRLANLGNAVFGIKPEIGAIRGVQALLAPLVARVVGSDVGNLNQTEQESAKKAVPLLTDTAEEKARKFAFMEKILGKAIFRAEFFEKTRRFPSNDELPDEYKGVLNFQIGEKKRDSKENKKMGDPLGIR